MTGWALAEMGNASKHQTPSTSQRDLKLRAVGRNTVAETPNTKHQTPTNIPNLEHQTTASAAFCSAKPDDFPPELEFGV
jgi:hypothetical protein